MYRGYSVEFLFIAIENCTDERVANRYRSFLGRFRKVVSIIRKFYFWTVKKNFSFVSVGLFFLCVYIRDTSGLSSVTQNLYRIMKRYVKKVCSRIEFYFGTVISLKFIDKILSNVTQLINCYYCLNLCICSSNILETRSK